MLDHGWNALALDFGDLNAWLDRATRPGSDREGVVRAYMESLDAVELAEQAFRNWLGRAVDSPRMETDYLQWSTHLTALERHSLERLEKLLADYRRDVEASPSLEGRNNATAETPAKTQNPKGRSRLLGQAR